MYTVFFVCVYVCVFIMYHTAVFKKLFKKPRGPGFKLPPFIILLKIRHSPLLADRVPRSPKRSRACPPCLETHWTTAGSWGLLAGVRHPAHITMATTMES